MTQRATEPLSDAELAKLNVSALVFRNFVREREALHEAEVRALRERIAELELIADGLMDRLVPDEETVHPRH